MGFNDAAGREAIRRVLEPQLVCGCGAMNRPGVVTVSIEEHGGVVCAQCGQGGPLQAFLPKEMA